MNFFKRLFKSSKPEIPITPAEINLDPSVPRLWITQPANEIEKPVEKKIPRTPLENAPDDLQPEIQISEPERLLLIDQIAIGEIDIHQNNDTIWDPLLVDAARLLVVNQMASMSLIQRRMKLGYDRAGKIMDQLELSGVVGPSLGSKQREIKIKNESDLEQHFQYFKLPAIDLIDFYNNNKEEIVQKKLEFEREKQLQQTKLEKELIKKELLEKERKKQLQREAYKELMDEGAITSPSSDNEWNREPIAQEVMDAVWKRDSGRCVKCGSNKNLEFDHIIPFSKGGASTYRNLQLLCKICNGQKSNNIG